MWVMRTFFFFFFLYSASVYSCHLFLISSASHMSIQFLSFIEPIFAWNFPLVSLIFLKRALALVFPILLFSSISLHWSLRKVFLISPCYSWNSAFIWVYHSFSPLPFSSFLFSAFYKASADNYCDFLHFFFLGMILILVSFTMPGTSVCNFSGILSIRSNPLKLFVTSTVSS